MHLLVQMEPRSRCDVGIVEAKLPGIGYKVSVHPIEHMQCAPDHTEPIQGTVSNSIPIAYSQVCVTALRASDGLPDSKIIPVLRCFLDPF